MKKAESRYFNTAQRMDEALISLLSEKDFEYVTVREICTRAKVNRSTFYLHYETLGDLLEETIEGIHTRFYRSFSPGQAEKPAADALAADFSVADRPLEQLYLMTDEWLLPYLRFVRENKRVYRAIYSNTAAFGVERTFAGLFRNIFSPILSRYGVPREKHEYMMTFYRYGLSAVVMRWVRGDCAEPVESMGQLIASICGRPGQSEREDRPLEKTNPDLPKP